jgi:uncharacterized membrane protein
MPGTLQAESVGPVDVAVILFEGSRFSGEIAPALLDLADSGVVRIIDASFVEKAEDGSVAVIEAADSDVAEAFERVTGTQFDLLSDDDLADVAAELPAGSSAMVIVWENTWAAGFAHAVRNSHGQLLSLDRIPHNTVLDAIAALEVE